MASNSIDFDLPAPRPGEAIYVDGIDWLPPAQNGKPDAADLAQWYAAKMHDGGLLRDLSTEKEYSGIRGLAELILDWLTIRRRRQTAKARRTRRRKPKRQFPGFYERLTPVSQEELERRFKAGKEPVDDLARAFATTRISIYRTARALGWKRN